MARIRTIKPEFWQDERIAALPFHARLLYIGLWTIADDAGRFRANPLFVKAQVFPYDLEVDVPSALAELERMGRVVLYSSGGESIGFIPTFGEHQRIDKPKPSRLPAPPEVGLVQDESKTDPGLIHDASKIIPGGKGRERNGREGKERKPSLQESFHTWAVSTREAELGPEYVPDADWGVARINKALKAAVVVEEEILSAAYLLFLRDKHKRSLSPPCPMWTFAQDWPQYVDKAQRAAVANG